MQSLYSLKEASYEFHEVRAHKLINCGFEQCLTHSCAFRKLDPRQRNEAKKILLGLVENLMVVGADFDLIALERHLNKFPKRNRLGELV